MTAVARPIPTEISPDALETIGAQFRFNHAKGVAELLKNSLDHYLRLREMGMEPRPGNWPVLLSLSDGATERTGPNFAVIDFGGTTYDKIRTFTLNWFNRSAASHGGAVSRAGLTGGHGNGGKFYMREMWRGGARLLTWRDGRVTSLIIERRNDGNTGIWELEDSAMNWRDALAHALPAAEGLGGAGPILEYLEDHDRQIISDLDGGVRGFTVVAGRRAQRENDVTRGGRWDAQRLVDVLHDVPQARRPIRQLAIAVLVNGALQLERLTPRVIEDAPDWTVNEVPVPGALIRDDADDLGLFELHKAAIPLTGRLRERNAVFVTDVYGNSIASYPINELPLPGRSTSLQFLHAELQLTFDQVHEYVQNDRDRLVPSEFTRRFLDWVSDRIWERVQEIEREEQDRTRKSELDLATVLNDALNQHSKRFLQERLAEIMVDFVPDPDGGGPGPSGTGRGRHGDGPGRGGTNGTGGGAGDGGTREVPGSTERVRRPKFPQVLLSDKDEDPANPGQSKHFTDRHPPLEQDDVDKQHNVWWINTEHPFAKEALKHGGATGRAFKSHQLYMFRDVVQRETLRLIRARTRELDLDEVENALSEMSNLFLGDLPRDLVEELLGDGGSRRGE